MRRGGSGDSTRSGGPADAQARPPVLLLTGIGLTAAAGVRWTAEFETRFRVFTAPLVGPGDDTASMTVEGALAMLDGNGVERAHVVGLSFGAVIAQEIAIRHPGRVRSLVLGASTAGGERYVPPKPAIRDFVRRLHELPAEEGLWASVPYLYGAVTCRRHAPLIGEDIAQRLTQPLEPRCYRRQHAIARAHDAGARLTEITAPTLVVHGQQDRILPVDNGRLLADAVAGARFMPLTDGAHAFPTDVPDATRELVSFLLAHSRRRQGSAAARSGRATRA